MILNMIPKASTAGGEWEHLYIGRPGQILGIFDLLGSDDGWWRKGNGWTGWPWWHKSVETASNFTCYWKLGHCVSMDFLQILSSPSTMWDSRCKTLDTVMEIAIDLEGIISMQPEITKAPPPGGTNIPKWIRDISKWDQLRDILKKEIEGETKREMGGNGDSGGEWKKTVDWLAGEESFRMTKNCWDSVRRGRKLGVFKFFK